jgi:hypothetical protein
LAVTSTMMTCLLMLHCCTASTLTIGARTSDERFSGEDEDDTEPRRRLNTSTRPSSLRSGTAATIQENDLNASNVDILEDSIGRRRDDGDSRNGPTISQLRPQTQTSLLSLHQQLQEGKEHQRQVDTEQIELLVVAQHDDPHDHSPSRSLSLSSSASSFVDVLAFCGAPCFSSNQCIGSGPMNNGNPCLRCFRGQCQKSRFAFCGLSCSVSEQCMSADDGCQVCSGDGKCATA